VKGSLSKTQAVTLRDESPGAVRMRRLRNARREAGLCPECGEAPAVGKKHCDDHLYIDRRRKRLTAFGVFAREGLSG